MKRMAAKDALLLLFLPLLAAVPARAQSVRARALEGVGVDPGDPGWRITIRFVAPIRYLRHAPEGSGDVILVQLDVGPRPIEAESEPARESANLPRTLPVPLADVVYEEGPGRDATLEIRFSRPVRFELRQGSDFRSIEVSLPDERPARAPGGVPPPEPLPGSPVESLQAIEPELDRPPTRPGPITVDLSHPYALQLRASPLGETIPPLPDLDVFRRYRVYTASTQRGGKTWSLLRLGFFASRASAEAVVPEVAASFPGARVVSVGLPERVASAKTSLASPGLDPGAAESSNRPLSPASDQVIRLMAEGREAMTRDDPRTAIRLFTKVLTLPLNARSPEAKELLGLARERNGQIAHAKAEYQEYLTLYPDGPGAERVQQRLDTLLTRHAAPKMPKRPRSEERARRIAFDVFGSLSNGYRTAARVTDEQGRDTIDSVAFSDFDMSARATGERHTIRSRLNGRYGYDFRDDGTASESRISTVFVDLEDREWNLGTTFGRQSRTTGGVLGRLDGALLRYRFRPHWELASVVGFPVDAFATRGIDTHRRLVGLSLEREHILAVVDAQIYGIHQLVDGLTDRSAVGAELRYAKNGRFVGAFLDYDLHYGSLNVASLVANLRLTGSLDLNLLADHRNTPFLTTTSALQGQSVDSIADLRDLFSEEEIEQFAEDRTARSSTFTAGASYRFSRRFQVAGDVSGTELSATESSGGVEGIEGTGVELGYLAQLIGNDLLMKGDLAILSLRYFDGDLADSYTVTLLGRYPLTRRLRLNPILRFDLRESGDGTDVLTFRPLLRINYRWGRFTIDLEAGGEWIRNDTVDVGSEELGYNLWFNMRYDF